MTAQATAQNADILDPAGPAEAPHLALARALEAVGRHADASAAYEEATRHDVHSLEARLGMARMLMILGRTSEAFAQADAVLAVDSTSFAAWAVIADALAALGETGFAAQACARAVQLAPHCVQLNTRLRQLREAAADAQPPDPSPGV